MKQWTFKEFSKLLENNGFSYLRVGKGSHYIYTNGTRNISVPKSMNCCVIRRLVKENDLK